MFTSAHRDIKPANILVFRDEGGGSFDFRLKLADFDRSSRVQRTNGTDTGTQDNDGSHAYCRIPMILAPRLGCLN